MIQNILTAMRTGSYFAVSFHHAQIIHRTPMRLILLIILFCLFAIDGKPLHSIEVDGPLQLDKSAVIDLAGLRVGMDVDSNVILDATHRLKRTRLFDSINIQPLQDSGGVSVHLVVRERPKRQFLFYGCALGTSLLGESRYWVAVNPGYVFRNLFRAPTALTFSMTAPYVWMGSASLEWFGCPLNPFSMGLTVSGRSIPYTTTPYFVNASEALLYLDYPFNRYLTARLSGQTEYSKTWKMDGSAWKSGSWQFITLNPDEFSDVRYSEIYPRTEVVPSLSLSLSYDALDNTIDPKKGYALFAEARHIQVTRLSKPFEYDYNQATIAAKGYLSLGERNVLVGHAKTIVRDRFDNKMLAHRLVFYDDGSQFRGFSSLAGTNIAFVNLEYRFRLFEMRAQDYLDLLGLPKERIHYARMLSYFADAIAFFDQGLFFGRVYSGEVRDVDPFHFSYDRDVFKSFGIGARAIYPSLGYTLTVGLNLW